MAGINELLPASVGDAEGPLAASVFKIERGSRGEKIAYARMFSGTIRTRERLRFGSGLEDKVTDVTVFEQGSAVQRPSVSPGSVAKLRGLDEIQVGDRIGELGSEGTHHQFRLRRSSRSSSLSIPTTARGFASRSASSPSRTR